MSDSMTDDSTGTSRTVAAIAARAADGAAAVEPTADDNILYRSLWRVKPEGMSLNAWAVKSGVNRNAFRDIRSSGRARTDTLEKLLGVARVSWAEFDAALAPVRTEVAAAGLVGTHDVHRAYHGEEPNRALPLVGSAIGDRECASVEEHVELTELHLGEVLEYLPRPASLNADQQAYALTIVGDSMAPKYEPGDRVAVSPRTPVVIGDYVIAQLRGEAEDDDRIRLVLIKRLVRRSHATIEFAQFQPEMTFAVDARRVVAMHKVVGTLF